MSSPWDAFPLVGKAKTPSSSPWDAFPLVNSAGSADEDAAAFASAKPLPSRQQEPWEFEESVTRQQQLRQRMAPPVIDQPSDEYAPVDPAKQYARFQSLRAMPSNQGINDADLEAQAQMELQPWEQDRELQEQAAWKAKQDAQLGYQPQFERPLENVSDEFARNLTGQPNIQNQPPQQQPLPAPRKMGNPQEQAMYDAAYQDVLAQLQAREGENYQANQKRVNEQAVYRDMPGQQLPPVLREIGSGLARTGTGIAAAGGMVADMISGETDYAKDWSQAGSNIARETENKAREQGGEGAAFASRNASGIVQSLATNMIAAPAGKIAQYAAGGLTSAGDAYGEARELGLDRNQAALYAVVNGALEGGSEFVAGKVGLGGMEDVLAGERKIAMKQGLGEAIKTIAKSGLAEGTTELPVSAAQEIARQVFSDGRADTAQTPEEWAKLFTDSFVQGFGGGAAAHGTQLVDAIEKAGLSKDVLKYGSASRKILDAIPESILPKHLREKMSQSDRIDMVKELRKREQEQPGLKDADPNARVGSEFAEPIAPMPDRGVSAEESDRAIAEHDAAVSKNFTPQQERDAFGFDTQDSDKKAAADALASKLRRGGASETKIEQAVAAAFGVDPGETQLSPENAAARLGQEQSVRQSDNPSQSQFNPEQAREEYQDQSFKRDSEKVFENIEAEQRPLRQAHEAQQAKVAEQAQTQEQIEKALSEAGEEQKNPRLMEIKQETIAEGKRKGWSKKKVEQVIANRATELPAAERRSEGKPAAIDFDVDRDKFNIDEVNKKDRSDMSGDEAKWLLGRSELTGLRNKRAYAESERRATTPYKSSIDINGLKQLNDRFGHGAGDDLIKQVGAVLKAQKALDIYHFSGDEFVARGSDEKSFGDSMRNLEQELLKQKVQFRGSDGKIYTLDGIRLGYGVAPTMEQAEQELSNAKAEQERKGNRELRSSWEQRFKSDPSALPKHVYERRSTPRSGSEGGKAETDKQYLAAPAAPGTATQKPSKPVSRFEHIIPEIRKRLLGSDVPLDIGAIKGLKNAKGYFDQHQHVVRALGKFAGEIHTISHEAAHNVDRLKGLSAGAPANIQTELGKMDYDPQRADPREGLSEFVYDYLSNNGQRSGLVKNWFEGVLAKDKKLGGDIAHIKNLVEQYQGQNPEDRVAADQGDHAESPDTRDFNTRARHLFTKIGGHFLDKLSGAALVEGKAAKSRGVNHDATSTVRQLMAETHGRTMSVFENGAYDVSTGKKMGPGMRDVLKALGSTDQKSLDNLAAYAEALRSLDHIKAGKATAMSVKDANDIVAKFVTDPKISKAQTLLVEHSQGMVKMARDAGLISPDEARSMLDAEPNYVPFSRVMDFDPFENQLSRSGKAFQKFKGSGRQLKDIYAAMLDKDARVLAAVNKAAAVNAFAKYADSPGMGWMIREVDADGADTMRIYRNGKYRHYRMDPGLAYSLESTFSPSKIEGVAKIVGDTFAGLAKLKRIGATGLNIGFQLTTNPLRDMFTAIMNTKGNSVKVLPRILAGAVQGAHDTISRLSGGKGNTYGQMLRELGVQTHGVGGDFEDSVGKVQDLINRESGKGWVNSLKSPLETAGDLLGVMESAPRIAEIMQVAEKVGYTAKDFESGKPMPLEVRTALGNAARRVTLDFQQGGTTTKALNKWRSFTNVAWQGPYQSIQNFKKQPAQFVTRGLVSMTLPMLGLWMRNKEDPEYKAMPAWQKMFFWNIKWGDTWIKIPRADVTGLIFAGVPEMMLNQAAGDKTSSKELQKEIAGAIPTWKSVIPDAFSPLMDVEANKDWRGRPIVGDDLKRLKPEDQYDENTTEFAKVLGRGLQMSPKEVDYLVSNYSGGLGKDVLKAKDQGPGEIFERRFTYRAERSKSVDTLYQKKQEVEQELNSAKLHGKSTDNLHKDLERLSDVTKVLTNIRTNMGDASKEEKIEVNRYMSGLADYALGNEKTKAYPLPDAKAPEAVKDAFADYIIQLVDQTRRRAGKMSIKDVLAGKTPEQKRQAVVDSIQAAKKDLADLGIDMEKARELIISRKTGIVKEAKAKMLK